MTKKIFLFFLLFIWSPLFSQNVGIGTATPDASALLELNSNQHGFLMTRISLTGTNDITTISNPATGLLVYNTATTADVTPGFYYWDGTKWTRLLINQSDDWTTTGNSGTTPWTNFLGTTDNQPLMIRTNNIPHFRLTQKGQIEVLNTGASIFLGQGAGNSDDLSNNANTFIGHYAGYSNTWGKENVANGHQALYHNTSGNYNVAIGKGALFNNTINGGNVAIGYFAMYLSNASTTLGDNVAIGRYTLMYNAGSYNIGIGYQSLRNNTTGYSNVAIGNNALNNNLTGGYNIAIGHSSLTRNRSGGGNIAIGMVALGSNNTGHHNVACGRYALYSNTSGHHNIAIGRRAAYYDTTGSYNVAVGNYSLYSLRNLNYNTAVGDRAYNLGNFSNSTALGYNTAINASNQIRLGNAVVTSIGGFAGWTNLSDARFKTHIQGNVPGIALIKKLRPITYHLDMDALAQALKTPDSLRLKEAEMLKAQEVQIGFIAQEVEQAASSLGFEFHAVDKPKNKHDFYGLRYAEFVPVLVKALQEQQEIIEQQQQEIKRLHLKHKMIEDLKKENTAMKKRIEKLEEILQEITSK